MIHNNNTMACHLRSWTFLLLCLIQLMTTTTKGSFSEESHIVLPSSSEKLTHLHFYYHDILQGENPTVVQIIDPGKSPNSIGTTFVMDNKLTEGPDLESNEVGRAQGLFGLASINDRGMVMLINFAFTGEGEYKGSTLSMLGRNPVQNTVRELPIVGGTGFFRFARGYAVAKSLWPLSSEEHFVVEYNVTVSHP